MNTLKKLYSNLVTSLKSLPRLAWVIVVGAFVIGFLINGNGASSETAGEMEKHEKTEAVTWWTCSMHPQIKLPEPGQCPICFMDLIPLEQGGEGEGPGELKLSENAVKLAEISTSIVKRGPARAEILLSGKIKYDETRVKKITAWVPGRLEHLYVDYTGITVSSGDHLVDIYSPELYSAQEELIQALEQVENSKSDLALETSRLTLDAAREKLSLLGLTPSQISEIEERKYPEDRLTVYSPISGIVIHKNALEGNYVQTGSQIYTIADLTRVWVILDAYESDLAWLRFGQSVNFRTEAIPGESFSGRISFIDPVLDDRTRTVKVRINLDNTGNLLKPGMFVRAKVTAELDSQGNPVNTELAGKWISPMHPEIVKDHPGQCDICGMDLVRAEEMGIVDKPDTDQAPLLVPATAVLKTGKRAIVYIKLPDREEPVFKGLEVVLGPRAGDHYVVLSGLKEGDEVVTRGNFKIDSALQIAAQPSMMNPEGGKSSVGHGSHGMEDMKNRDETGMKAESQLSASTEYYEIVNNLYDYYFDAQTALAGDDLEASRKSLVDLDRALTGIEANQLNLSRESLEHWESNRQKLLKVTEHAGHWSDITAVRGAFEKISSVLIVLEKSLGHSNGSYFEVFCPMAFNNKGAGWLQKGKEVFNPYFGQKMLRCGEIRTEFKAEMMEQDYHE